MPVSERDVEIASASKGTTGSGRRVIAVIGIDRYDHWPRLSNAVRDASGAEALFRRLGFEEVTAPVLDERATGKAIQSLVTDDLTVLGPEDSLVLFYAGHGGTRKHRLGGEEIRTGYLIPVDASSSPDRGSTWVELEGWLRAVSLLPAKHILVVLDACHSGIALDPIIKWRDIGSWQDTPLSTLQARRSRRIITSALDDQVALDSGPVHGHSLFTGCLIEGLTDGIRRSGSRVTTGSELGLYLQRRVQTYPHSRQTPDFGTFAFDDRGEMVIPLAIEDAGRVPIVGEDGLRYRLVVGNATAGRVEPQPQAPTAPQRPIARRASLTPQPPAELAKLTVSRLAARRWIILGGVGATLATALVGYLIFGQDSSRSNSSDDTPSRVAASNLPDARPADAASSAAPAGLPDAQPQHPPDAHPVDAAFHAAPAGPPDAQPQPRFRPGGCPPGMVRVPPGTFRMGSPEGVGADDEHPQHEVTLPAYCIDKTEVTVKAYAACVAAKGCSAAPLTVNWSGDSAADVEFYSGFCNRDDRPDHPINCVDWNQAAAYCKWAHKRLPTEAEWEYAARGNDNRAYPWGNEAPSAKRLNACGSECVAMVKRELNLHGKSMYEASDGWVSTAPRGEFPGDASPFGVLDMAGNVVEWTADWYGPYTAVAAANPRGAKRGTFRVVRGGAWYSNDAALVRAANRIWTIPSYRINYVGFRCGRGD
jgi:formylglycine-generating enzyme required for sulfatase activity